MNDAAPSDAPRATSAQYDPEAVEDRWYGFWEQEGFFAADEQSEREPFAVMMPPPNVTGRLHIGHALQSTIQDVLTRIARMKGREALWQPGLDHAGIATQNVVERKLEAKEGKTRHDLGRKSFVERVYQWKEEYGDIITGQMRRLGVSCDWSRRRFTMDEGFTRAVQEVFVRLHEEGLIYRGDYLVNWDPENQTALSDEEVDNEERAGHLWHVRYPLGGQAEAAGSGAETHGRAPPPGGAGEEATLEYLTIATTRPETMLGDTAVAVHPEDERYAHLIGRTVALPLLGRELPVVADEHIDAAFGTGALKVTPAHDESDFEIGQRHDLETVNVMNEDGTINENGGPYEGMDRFEARAQIVDDLEAEGLLESVEEHTAQVPVSSRSGAVVEPLISRQWFVEMEPLAALAIEAVEGGEIDFYPERWASEYFRWMENIRDWCISRQLWWGHRIPVWYYLDEDGNVDESRGYEVAIEQPEAGMVQETDVLDTWFSSWLWPFATLGWPEGTDALEKFYPTDVLVSGYDILFFWIARMVMAGKHFTGEAPFEDIFITGMVKDEQGRWMSKSLGNGIDPLEMIDQYGADAVRFSLTVLCAQGQDIKLAPSKFEMGRNFANKIWNAFNVFGQFMEEGETYQRQRDFAELELVEQWMLTRLRDTIVAVEDDLERYRLNEALQKIYHGFWSDYCDWYLELIKPPYGEEMAAGNIALAAWIYERLLELLHPFMPFVTEELWHRLRPRAEGEALIAAAWPRADDVDADPARAETFAALQEMIAAVRSVKSDYGVGQGQEIAVSVRVASADRHARADGLAEAVRNHAGYFEKLAGVTALAAGPGEERPPASAAKVAGESEVFVPLEGMIDLEKERERLRSEIENKRSFLDGIKRKLRNEQFITKAPDEVVERERQKRRDATDELERLRANLDDLG